MHRVVLSGNGEISVRLGVALLLPSSPEFTNNLCDGQYGSFNSQAICDDFRPNFNRSEMA